MNYIKVLDPGKSTWKFQLGEKIKYRQRNYDALKLWWRLRDWKTFSVHVRTQQGWKYVVTHTPSDICICGKSYETPNGELFKFQEHPLEYTIVELEKTMRSPVLCQMCYYKGEINAGRWAPKNVRQQLGLET